MGIFPGFGGLINLNIQQPVEGNSMQSENVNSKSRPENDNKKIYYDEEEENRQVKLWIDAEKKTTWIDNPPKAEVTTKRGLCHMKIGVIVRLPPDSVYDLLTNGSAYFDFEKWRDLMVDKSVKVLKEEGPRKVMKVEKAVAWDLIWWSIPIRINLTVHENRKDLTTKYKADKMMFMKVFKGNCKVEPLYMDAHLCKRYPKSAEEYKKCSKGQGKIASMVTLNQYFQLYPLFDIPPVSWYIRRITIKTTKHMLKWLQENSGLFREDTDDLGENTLSKKHGKTSPNDHKNR